MYGASCDLLRAKTVVTGGGVWHKASVSDCLPLAAHIGLLPPHILTLGGSERVLVVSTEPPDDLSCLTTPGVGCPGDGAVARAVDQGHPEAHWRGGGVTEVARHGPPDQPAIPCSCSPPEALPCK